jgi:hypothetical protein
MFGYSHILLNFNIISDCSAGNLGDIVNFDIFTVFLGGVTEIPDAPGTACHQRRSA